jgi:hypothetical protein
VQKYDRGRVTRTTFAIEDFDAVDGLPADSQRVRVRPRTSGKRHEYEQQ